MVGPEKVEFIEVIPFFALLEADADAEEKMKAKEALVRTVVKLGFIPLDDGRLIEHSCVVLGAKCSGSPSISEARFAWSRLPLGLRTELISPIQNLGVEP